MHEAIEITVVNNFTFATYKIGDKVECGDRDFVVKKIEYIALNDPGRSIVNVYGTHGMRMHFPFAQVSWMLMCDDAGKPTE